MVHTKRFITVRTKTVEVVEIVALDDTEAEAKDSLKKTKLVGDFNSCEYFDMNDPKHVALLNEHYLSIDDNRINKIGDINEQWWHDNIA